MHAGPLCFEIQSLEDQWNLVKTIWLMGEASCICDWMNSFDFLNLRSFSTTTNWCAGYFIVIRCILLTLSCGNGADLV